MPTLLVIKNLMFIIHTRDHLPPHVTVYAGSPEKWEATAKVRLDSVVLLDQENFSARSIKFILQIVGQNQVDWMEEWNDWFKNR